MMIYLLSDIHGDMNFNGLKEYIQTAGEDDLLIVLGDIGLMYAEREDYKEFTEFFLSIDKNIAFLDGNHENFDFIESFPEEDWNGGKVHRLSESIVHLKRGNVFTLEDKTFFVMGGCKSSQKWKDMGLWYEREEPSNEEIAFAIENLKNHGNKVDFVLTHKYEKPKENPAPKTLEALTKYIDENIDFSHWYAGHWHQTELNRRHSTVYNKLIKLF